MENNNRYDELLIKYLVDEVNADEKMSVETWLNTNKENQEYFDSLKKALQLTHAKQTLDYVIDEMNVEEKWSHFKQSITAKEQAKVIAIGEQEESYGEDQRLVEKPMLFRLLRFAAVAASVILVIGLGWKFFANNNLTTPVVQDTERKRDSLIFVERQEINTTGKDKNIRLPDGSLVVLTNKSEIRYKQPFVDKRNITLKGKAYFQVAKDKTKPFTVISGEISTTALGTEFTVTAFKNTNRIVVRLYEGKVVVKAIEKGNRKLKKEVYLLPGQEFVYGNKLQTKVKTFTLKKNDAPEDVLKDEETKDNPFIPNSTGASWYMFNNQSLEKVLGQLADMYNVPIIFEKKDLKNIYFTGKYNTSDSLEVILQQIGRINNLTITKKESGFIITK